MLEVLLHELAELRDDDRYMHSQYPTIIAGAIALIAGMATLYSTTFAVPIWIYVAAPILPIIFISYTVVISALGTLRSHYRRVIEQKIHALTSQSQERLPIPSWGHMELEVMGYDHAEPRVRLNWLLIYGGLVLLVIGGCIALALKIPSARYRIFSLSLDGMLMTIPVSAAIVSIRKGANLWYHSTSRLPEHLDRTAKDFHRPNEKSERALTSYLLLPRNQEELLKALFIPAGLLIGLILAPDLPHWTWGVGDWAELRCGFWYFAGYFFVFEFVVYQGRYLLNDVRDRFIDCEENLSKRRFPCSWVQEERHANNTYALKLAFGSFIGRLGLAILIVGCILPYKENLWSWNAGFLASVFLIAIIYENVRNQCKAKNGKYREWWTLALTLTVGLGYSLRSLVGLWLAGISNLSALLLMGFGASAFGSMFVALTWALESTRTESKVLLEEKPHLVLYQNIVTRTVGLSWSRTFTSQKVLAGFQEWMSPWCISGVISTGMLAAFVLDLNHVYGGIGHLLLIGIGVAIIAEPVAVARIRITRVSTILGLALAVIVFHHLSMSWGRSLTAAFVTMLPLITMCIFRNMSFDELPNVVTKIGKFVGRVLALLFSWFAKERKIEALESPSESSSV